MKPVLALSFAVLVFASSSHAQNATAAQAQSHSQPPQAPRSAGASPANLYTPGCGPGDDKFDVKTDNTPQPDPTPEPGKAIIYFVQDDRFFSSRPRPTVVWGVDGSWIGATRTRTYFHITVDPGEHHLCARWQTAVIASASIETAVAHFVAEPGRIYYFRAQNLYWRNFSEAAVTLEPVDSDEGALLASQSGYSVATLKK
jgi:hypothetical protein